MPYFVSYSRPTCRQVVAYIYFIDIYYENRIRSTKRHVNCIRTAHYVLCVAVAQTKHNRLNSLL